MSLLPANATKYERALEKTSARSFSLPVLIDRLRNPAICPLSVLPWLAYERSVDEWNEEWSEEQKRQVTARSISVHKKKGTRGAVEEALRAIGLEVSPIEWWEVEPMRERGTFDLQVTLPEEKGLGAEDFSEIVRLVDRAKNTRSHLRVIQFLSKGTASLIVGGMCEVTRPVIGKLHQAVRGASSLGSVGAAYFVSEIRCNSRL